MGEQEFVVLTRWIRPLMRRAVRRVAIVGLCLSFLGTAMAAPMLPPAPGECRDLLAARAATLAQRKVLVERLRAGGVPFFFRTTPSGDLPVVLLNARSFPFLKDTLAATMAMPVELTPGGGTDHGMFRLGHRLIDFLTPGQRLPAWDPNRTGVLWRPLAEWLGFRAEKA